jgi:hypothetical protein
MVDIALDVLDAQGPSGAQFVANNRKGADMLGFIIGEKVYVNQVVMVDGWVYKDLVEKLVARKVTVLNYTALKDW